MSYIGAIKSGTATHRVGSTLYGTCGTAAATAAKVVTLSDFDNLTPDSIVGVTVHVKFTYSNTAANATLKVGSTDAKPLCRYGTTRVGTSVGTSWRAGAVVAFTYDGTSWVMNDYIEDTDTHNTSKNVVGGSAAATANAAASNPYLNHLEGTTVTSHQQIKGSGGTTVASDASGNITISSGTIPSYSTLTQAEIDTGTDTTGKLITAKLVHAIYESVSAAFVYKGTKATVADLPATGNKTGDVWHVTENEGEYAWDGTSWQELGSLIDMSLSKSSGDVKGVKTWSAGTVPTLGTAISVGSASAWDAGSTPTLGTAISATKISAWDAGSVPTLGTAIAADDITSWSAGTLPSITIDTEDPYVIPNVTGVGSVPSLTKADVTIPNVTSVGTAPSLTVTSTGVVTAATVASSVVASAAVSEGVLTLTSSTQSVTTGNVGSASNWSAGTVPTLGTAISATKINSWSAGSTPTLGTAIEVEKVSDWSAGTLPTLSYTARSIPNVTGVGSVPSLTKADVSIPNVTDVGKAPSLTITNKSVPNVTNVGTAPSLTTDTLTFLTDVSLS